MYTRGLALAAALLAAVLDLLDGTVVNVVLPAIQRELHTGHTESTAAAWIASGYTLALGVLLTVGGRAGEVFGPRRVLTAGVCGFALTSLACAAAPTASALVLARIAQGAMAAFMVPQVLTLVQLLYPPDQRGRALSLFATVAGLATVSGPLAGALLAEADLYGLGWRAVFLINVPLSVLVVAGTRALPQVPRRPSGQLGLPSAVLLALGLLSWMFPLLHGRADSWPWWSWPLLAAGGVLLAGFGVREVRRSRREAQVLMDTRLFRLRGFTGAVTVTAVVYAAVFGLFFTLALYLQQGLGRGPLQAAATVLPWALGIPVTSTVASRWLVARCGRRVLSAGTVTLTAGLAGAAWLVTATPVGPTGWQLAGPLLVAGCGMGLVVAPVLSLGLANVPLQWAGTASGVLNNVQQLAGVLGVTAAASGYSAALDGASATSPSTATAAFSTVLCGLTVLCGAALPAGRLLPRTPATGSAAQPDGTTKLS